VFQIYFTGYDDLDGGQARVRPSPYGGHIQRRVASPEYPRASSTTHSRAGSPTSTRGSVTARAVIGTMRRSESVHDLMLVHSDVFTEPSPGGFTPRTLRTNATSVLTKYRLEQYTGLSSHGVLFQRLSS